MAEFKTDTGWSVFDIYMDGSGEQPGYTVRHGSKGTLLNISVSNSGVILDMGLICAERIYQEETSLPERDSVGRHILPTGPDEEESWYLRPLWVNLHPRKRQLEIIFLPPKYDCIRSDSCFRDGRVEIYYNTSICYDEDADITEYQKCIMCIKLLDLSEEEYEYLRKPT